MAQANNRLRLAVEDAGPGIPAEERARIFDRFHRATDQPGGAGLGLAIADAVVRATHARWEIGESSLGGASVAVSWPRWSNASREEAATSPEPATPPPPPPAATDGGATAVPLDDEPAPNTA